MRPHSTGSRFPTAEFSAVEFGSRFSTASFVAVGLRSRLRRPRRGSPAEFSAPDAAAASSAFHNATAAGFGPPSHLPSAGSHAGQIHGRTPSSRAKAPCAAHQRSQCPGVAGGCVPYARCSSDIAPPSLGLRLLGRTSTAGRRRMSEFRPARNLDSVGGRSTARQRS